MWTTEKKSAGNGLKCIEFLKSFIFRHLLIRKDQQKLIKFSCKWATYFLNRRNFKICFARLCQGLILIVKADISAQKYGSKWHLTFYRLSFSTFVGSIAKLELRNTLLSGPVHPKYQDHGCST